MNRLLLAAALLLSTPALADGPTAAPAYYVPDEVIESSEILQDSFRRSGEAYGPVDAAFSRTNRALGALDRNLAVTPGAIDAAQHQLWQAYLDERATLFTEEADAVQAQIDRLQVVYIDGSAEAIDRAGLALAAYGYTPVVECAATSPPSIQDITGPGARSPTAECEGANVSERIAKLLDADEEYGAAVRTMTEESWPSITTYSTPQPALNLSGVPDGSTWVSPSDLVESVPEAIEYLDAVESEAARGRAELLDEKRSLSQDDPDLSAKLHSIRSRAIALREWGEARKAELGTRLWTGLDRARKKGKKEGWADVGVCMNPEGWGGCSGLDVTETVADVMVDDRKLRKDLADLLEALESPAVGP